MIMQLHIDITGGIKLGENKQEFRKQRLSLELSIKRNYSSCQDDYGHKLIHEIQKELPYAFLPLDATKS